MIAKVHEKNSRTGDAGMSPSLINAARHGDFEEAIEALKNPDSINETSYHGLNALQVAMVNFHTELGLFLIENSDISVFHQDDMGRDALDIAFICSNNALGDLIYDKWNKERALKISNKKEGTTSIHPRPK